MTLNKTKLPRKIRTFHIFLIGLLLLNFLLYRIWGFSLIPYAETFLIVLLFISGIALFINSVRNGFKNWDTYGGIYLLYAALILLGYSFRGSFLGALGLILLMPISPDKLKFSDENTVVYAHIAGFMAPCCSYRIAERKLLLLEKTYAIYRPGEEINFNSVSIQKTKHKTILRFRSACETLSGEPSICDRSVELNDW